MYAGMRELRVFCPIDERARTIKNAGERKNGAQGRNRTTDTAIFSRMLYQLSYLGVSERPKGLSSGRFIVAPDRDVHPASRSARYAGHSPFSPSGTAGRSHLLAFGRQLGAVSKILENRPYSASSTSSSRPGTT
jgi:hypothetical protein